MKTFKMLFSLRWLSVFGLWMVAIAVTGCGAVQAPMVDTHRREDALVERVRISALTEFVTDSAQLDAVQLKVLLEVLDTSGEPAPVPCILRFELYEFRPLSADPRGKRVFIWPEMDLSDLSVAKEHWKDLLRGYEFYLPLDNFTPQPNRKYLLEVTCFADQRRYSDLFKMQFQP